MHELPRRYAIIVGIFAVAQVVANVGLRCHILMVADGLRGPSKYIFLFALRWRHTAVCESQICPDTLLTALVSVF